MLMLRRRLLREPLYSGDAQFGWRARVELRV